MKTLITDILPPGAKPTYFIGTLDEDICRPLWYIASDKTLAKYSGGGKYFTCPIIDDATKEMEKLISSVGSNVCIVDAGNGCKGFLSW